MNDEIVELDVIGLPCPLPIVKLKKQLANLDEGVQMIRLKVSDEGALKDVPAFCQLYQLQCRVVQTHPWILFEISTE